MKKRIIFSQKELRQISKNREEIYVKAKFGPSQSTKIPLKLDEYLSFFVAAIIGDGHLRKDVFRISLDCTDKGLIKYIQKVCKRLFKRDFKVNLLKKRKGKKPTFRLDINNKAIYKLLNYVFEIPSGKKSYIVKVPESIFKANKSIKSAFLIGIMATEGGRRGRGLGLSTASKQLWKDLIIIFNDLKIPVFKDKWLYKKYKKHYYGLSFRKEYLSRIMQGCRSGQTGQILSKHKV